jgi:L-fuconolactonase
VGPGWSGSATRCTTNPTPVGCCDPDVQRGLAAVEAAGLAFDLLVRTRELPAALETVRAHPGLRFVIDHLAKPPIREGARQPWADRLAAYSGLANTWCKVSGLVTEATWDGWRGEPISSYVNHAVDVFGPDRLLFGSDWPVCLLAASYAQVLGLAHDTLSTLSERERAGVFGENARAAYALVRSA